MDRYFQTIRPLRKVGKLRGSLDFPVFSQQVLPTQGCLEATKPSAASDLFVDNVAFSTTATFTIEFWCKIMSYNTVNLPSLWNSLGTLNPVKIEAAGNNLTVDIIVFAGTRQITGIAIPYNEWFHCAVTYDSVIGLAVYINGVQASEGWAAEGVLTVTPRRLYMAHPVDATAIYRVAEMRLWSTYKTPEEIAFYYNKYVGGNETGLVGYWRFNELTGTTGADLSPTGEDFTLVTGWEFDDDFPLFDLLLGISFVIGEFTFATGRNISLKFPVVKPYDEINFMPVIRWTDEDDVVHRYKLWEVDGVDMTPIPPDYNGERIPNGAVIEIWNIDGEENVELTEAITLITSLLNTVTSYITTGNPSSGSLGELNTAIFSALPAAIPINFDQNYIP